MTSRVALVDPSAMRRPSLPTTIYKHRAGGPVPRTSVGRATSAHHAADATALSTMRLAEVSPNDSTPTRASRVESRQQSLVRRSTTGPTPGHSRSPAKNAAGMGGRDASRGAMPKASFATTRQPRQGVSLNGALGAATKRTTTSAGAKASNRREVTSVTSTTVVPDSSGCVGIHSLAAPSSAHRVATQSSNSNSMSRRTNQSSGGNEAQETKRTGKPQPRAQSKSKTPVLDSRVQNATLVFSKEGEVIPAKAVVDWESLSRSATPTAAGSKTGARTDSRTAAGNHVSPSTCESASQNQSRLYTPGTMPVHETLGMESAAPSKEQPAFTHSIDSSERDAYLIRLALEDSVASLQRLRDLLCRRNPASRQHKDVNPFKLSNRPLLAIAEELSTSITDLVEECEQQALAPVRSVPSHRGSTNSNGGKSPCTRGGMSQHYGSEGDNSTPAAHQGAHAVGNVPRRSLGEPLEAALLPHDGALCGEPPQRQAPQHIGTYGGTFGDFIKSRYSNSTAYRSGSSCHSCTVDDVDEAVHGKLPPASALADADEARSIAENRQVGVERFCFPRDSNVTGAPAADSNISESLKNKRSTRSRSGSAGFTSRLTGIDSSVIATVNGGGSGGLAISELDAAFFFPRSELQSATLCSHSGRDSEHFERREEERERAPPQPHHPAGESTSARHSNSGRIVASMPLEKGLCSPSSGPADRTAARATSSGATRQPRAAGLRHIDPGVPRANARGTAAPPAKAALDFNIDEWDDDAFFNQ